MIDFSMKLHGVWAILCWKTFISLYSLRRLQIINARNKDIGGFKFGYRDIKVCFITSVTSIPKLAIFCELSNTYEKPTGKFNVGFINYLVNSFAISYLEVESILL